MAAWNSLRDSPDSRYLVLTAPRTLVRQPLGPGLRAGRGDGLRRGCRRPGSQQVSVGNRPRGRTRRIGHEVVCRVRLARRRFAARKAAAKYRICPLHTFPSLSGSRITKCPTETTITDRREKELSDQGIISLCHARNTDYAVVFSGSTVNRPQKYVEEEANANARLSASLPYILACSRFAHYLKSIMRDKVGGFTSRDEVERFLNNWIVQYVTSDDTASHATKARYPLREARVQVSEVPGKPGAYTAVAHLRPALPARRAHRVAAPSGGLARRVRLATQSSSPGAGLPCAR